MMPLRRFLGCLALVLLGFPPVAAQFPPLSDPPQEHRPRRPPTKEELARREARVLYGLGILRQQRDRLNEAVRLFEEAAALDPEAAPVQRALVSLYSALGRTQDALAASGRVLQLVADDPETWALRARLLQGQGQLREAREAVQRAAACPSLRRQPDLFLQIYHQLGNQHEDLGEHEQAVKAYREILGILESPERLHELENEADPDLVREQAVALHERIVRLWIQGGKPEQAVAAFRDAAGRYPALATRLNLQMAKVHVALGQHDAALARLDDYLRTQPVNTEGYELKAAVLEKLGRATEVLPTLEAYAQRDRHNLALQLLLARHYGQAGRAEQAERFYQALLEKHPAQPEMYRGLFTLYREQGRVEKVLVLLEETLIRAAERGGLPGDAVAATRGRHMLTVLREDAELGRELVALAVGQLDAGRRLQTDTCFFLATLALRARQLPAAERLFQRCLEGKLPPQIEVATYDGLLRVLWETRNYAAVLRVCERGLQNAAGANRLLFHLNRSRALVHLGKVEDGLAEADRAVAAALDGDTRFAARVSRLRVLWHAERLDAALAECQALLKERLQPAQARDVRQLLSGIYSAQRDYPRAEAQLQLVLKDDPNDAGACNDLGYLWADQGKHLAESERLIRKAIELDREQKKGPGGEPEPDNAAYLDSLGWVLYRKGDPEGARQWLEKAATLPGGADDPVVWDHLGDVYSQLGDSARAAAAWRKSLDLYEKENRRKADHRVPEIRRKLQR